jgi:hypothetical protein
MGGVFPNVFPSLLPLYRSKTRYEPMTCCFVEQIRRLGGIR